MIKKSLLLLLLSISFLYSDNIEIEVMKNKEIFYLIEKEGYNINYQMNNTDLIKFFNYEIKNLKFDSINSLLEHYKESGFKYFLENKNLTFYKDKELIDNNTSIENKNINLKNNQNQSFLETRNSEFKNNYLKYEVVITNDKENEKFLKDLQNIFEKNKNSNVNLNLNYYGSTFKFFVYEENLNEIKNILKNNDKMIKENDINNINEDNYLKLVLNEYEKSITKYENLLIVLLNNTNKTNQINLPYLYGKIKFFNDNYIYLLNINNNNFDKYVDKYNKIYELKNENTFNNFSNVCMIKDNNIICENDKYIIKY